MEQVRTERLVGTRPLLRDADELHPISADPRVARWVWPEPLSLAQTRSMLVRDAAHWNQHRFGRWVWRESGHVVGLAGLLSAGEEVELAWLVSADRWGEGLATEMARETVRFAFAELGLPGVVAKTLPDNLASRAVMERCGFVREADIVHAGLPHVRYRLTSSG